MALLIHPENPTFRHNSERQVYEAILPHLGDEDAVFTNLELTDAQSGDIEIDMVVLIKDRGCIVIETKGGNIAFDGDNWIQSDPSGSREIYPGLQAKKNMDAVRDYIRKRWSQGNLKTEWVVAFPNCNVADNRSTELPFSAGHFVKKLHHWSLDERCHDGHKTSNQMEPSGHRF